MKRTRFTEEQINAFLKEPDREADRPRAQTFQARAEAGGGGVSAAAESAQLWTVTVRMHRNACRRRM